MRRGRGRRSTTTIAFDAPDGPTQEARATIEAAIREKKFFVKAGMT